MLQNALLAAQVQDVQEEERPGYCENCKKVAETGFKFTFFSLYDRSCDTVFRNNGNWCKTLPMIAEPAYNFDGFFALCGNPAVA